MNGCTCSHRIVPVSRSAATSTGVSASLVPYARMSPRAGIGRYGSRSPCDIRHFVAPVAKSIISNPFRSRTVANGLCGTTAKVRGSRFVRSSRFHVARPETGSSARSPSAVATTTLPRGVTWTEVIGVVAV